jgi:hypothetical protein
MTRKLSFLLLTILLIAACGSAANGASGSPDEPVSAPAQSDGGGRHRPELREPEEGLEGVRPRIFDRHRADGRKVTLFYYSGVDECYGLDHIKIRERPRKVTLTIFEGHHPEPEACPDIAVKVRSIATLQRPLGDRKVVDGAR